MFDRYLVPLRGRADETRKIDQGFAGERTVTVFAGEPGIGKTRLLQYGSQTAADRGWSTMVVAPDADSALAPLGALVDAATRFLTTDDLQAVMRGAAPQYWLTRLLADRLEVAAGRTGMLVIVDDLQWLDAGSLSAVTALVHDLQGVPVSWLLATRTGVYSAAHQRFLSRFAPLVELSPLDRTAVEAMTLDALGGMPGPGVENAIRRAAGSPLLVLELLRGLEEEGLLRSARGLIDIADDTLPARFGTSARDRLRQVSRDALRIAQVGSLYGREFPLGGVLDVIGRTPTEAAPAIQELLDHSFLVDTGRSLAFRHDTVQAAAAHSLSPTLRRAMTREVLQRRLHAGESVAVLASMIASVADDDSPELLFLAANQLAATDMRGAADLAVLGARLAAGHARHADRVAALLPLVLAGGQIEEAMEISRTLRPLLSADARARAGLAVARRLTESDFDAAITETGAALAIPGISDETRVQLLAVRALNFANKADPSGLRSSLEAARAVADENRDGLALATIDATSSVLTFNQGHFDEADRRQQQALERVARAGTVAGLWLPEGLWTAFMRTATGHCSEALRLTDEGLAQARAAHHVIAEAYWMMVRARTLYDLGRLDDAQTQAETVLDLGAQLGLGDFANATAGVVLHRIALRTGDIALRDSVRPLIQQLAAGVGLTRTGRWSLALEALERGRPRDAHAEAASALASLREPVPSMTTPADFADDITLAYICLLVNDRPSLDLVADVARERADLNPGNALCRAVATATRGLRDRSAADLRNAADQVRPVGRPLVTARLLEAAGMLDSDDTAALSGALHLFEQHGATRDANRVLHALRGRGVHKRPQPPGDDPSGLSHREHQVAERIAAGLTTQQIADELLVSPHTVVTYIRHIYAKWGVNSRRGVADRFARSAGMKRVSN